MSQQKCQVERHTWSFQQEEVEYASLQAGNC